MFCTNVLNYRYSNYPDAATSNKNPFKSNTTYLNTKKPMVDSFNFNELLSASNVCTTRQVLLIDSLNQGCPTRGAHLNLKTIN